MRLRFGECTLDRGARELIRDGVHQDLSPKAFQLLELLLETRPRALSKREIGDRLWPDSIVSASSLPRLVAEVRAAIGDDAKRPTLLRTIHRHGYAFFGTISNEAPDQANRTTGCRLLWGERQISLPEGESILGRAAEARVSIDLGRISRQHARIVVRGGMAVLEDLGSKNGTFHRGKRVAAPVELADGDEICVGPVLMVFRAATSTTTTQTGTTG